MATVAKAARETFSIEVLSGYFPNNNSSLPLDFGGNRIECGGNWVFSREIAVNYFGATAHVMVTSLTFLRARNPASKMTYAQYNRPCFARQSEGAAVPSPRNVFEFLSIC